MSKDISAKINSLQNNKFDFKNDGNKSFEQLCKLYPKCNSVIKWWCNCKVNKNGKFAFNIKDNFGLKEFMIANPPTFKISSRCCEGAKKHPSGDYEKKNNIDLKCMGLRLAEGGIRAQKIHSCFTDNLSYDPENPNKKRDFDEYRPIWWFTDKDKKEFESFYKVVHSGCYTKYGFKRTGCCGCPYNSNFEKDLEIIKNHEPNLWKAVNNIFSASYEYTRAYRKFKDELKNNR